MKNGKRPTVRQMELMRLWRLNPNDWLVVKDTPDAMTVVHRLSDKTTRIIPKRASHEPI